MIVLPILIISFIQGFTEFLPISSQGHNIFIAKYLDYSVIELRTMNIIAHTGSLLAIIMYNFKIILKLLASTKNFFRADLDNYASLLKNLIVSTIPLIFFGYIITQNLNNAFFESLKLIGYSSIFFGSLFYIIDTNCLTIKSINRLEYKGALIVGIFQSFAIIPGASRAGLVITGLRLLGYNRFDAASYSNILSIPAILGAIFYLLVNLNSHSFSGIEFEIWNIESVLIFLLSFIFSFIFIHFLLTWVKKRSFSIFMAYRLLFGFVILAYSYNYLNF